LIQHNSRIRDVFMARASVESCDNVVTMLCRLFDAQNTTMPNGGNYILETALHEYLLQAHAPPACILNLLMFVQVLVL